MAHAPDFFRLSFTTLMLDFMELHIWMAQAAGYYDEVGYHYERFDPKGYENLVSNAKPVYMQKRDYWDGKLKERIEMCAQWSRVSGKPLITTECWSLVDYKYPNQPTLVPG